jgi:hypothetical protein
MGFLPRGAKSCLDSPCERRAGVSGHCRIGWEVQGPDHCKRDCREHIRTESKQSETPYDEITRGIREIHRRRPTTDRGSRLRTQKKQPESGNAPREWPAQRRAAPGEMRWIDGTEVTIVAACLPSYAAAHSGVGPPARTSSTELRARVPEQRRLRAAAG